MNSISSELSSPRTSRKACISPNLYFTKYSESRPKGKTRGEFYGNSTQTFEISSTSSLNSKSSKKLFHLDSSVNPILQDTSLTSPQSLGKKILAASPSPILVYSSQRKFNLPSEMGIGNRYEKYYASEVFKESKTCYLFNGKTKNLLAKEGQLPSLLRYDFALPYKDEKITPKIGNSR